MSVNPDEFELDDVLVFDPLADDEPDDEDETTEFIGIVERPDDRAATPPVPELPPEERTRELIKKMPGRRKVLLGIMEFCRKPQSPTAVDEFTDGLQKSNYSVYTPVVLRHLLEEAGALEYLEAPEAANANPADAVDEDGYLVVTKRPEGTWVTTAAGIAVLDSLNPQQELLDLLERDSTYLEIYRRILSYCAEEPRSKKQLDDLVDNDPLVQSPRRYSGYFVDKLEACDALEWAQKWSTTDIGKEVL
jgi:hypothetical protein